LKEWFEDWNITKEEKTRCLRILHDTLIKCHQREAPAMVMLELLSLYTEKDADKAKDDAIELIRSALADPAMFIFDHLLKLSPVQGLRSDRIFALLQIFVSGSLDDYMKFYSENKDYISTLRLDHEALLYKMRILTLMTVGEESGEISLEGLAKKLQISFTTIDEDQELETFIIQAVQTKMIKAKIDEIAGRVLISGVKNRQFSKPQWEQLNQKLGTWHSNLTQLKTYLDSVVLSSPENAHRQIISQ